MHQVSNNRWLWWGAWVFTVVALAQLQPTAAVAFVAVSLVVMLQQRGVFAGLPKVDPAWEMLLRGLDPDDLPRELLGTVPRVDVFSGRGYLRQQRYRDRYLPLLLHGHAAPGLVVQYSGETTPTGVEVAFTYGWVDAGGDVHLMHMRESYDPVQAALAVGHGEMVLDLDAGLSDGARVTVVAAADGSDAVIYEALRCTPDVT